MTIQEKVKLGFRNSSGLPGFGMSGGGAAPAPTLSFVTNATYFLATFTFSAGGGPMTIDFGDGSAKSTHATKAEKVYPDTTDKTVVLSCPDWSKLTSFSCNYLKTSVYKDMPDTSFATNLTTLTYSPKVNKIPTWVSGLTKLTSFAYTYDAGLLSYDAGALVTQKSLATVSLYGSYLQAASVSNLFSDMLTSLSISGRVACTLNISSIFWQTYANGYVPSEADAANAATLIAAGWTVPNIVHPWLGIIGDSIDAGALCFMLGSPWVESVHTAYTGSALHNVARASQGIIAGGIANMAVQVAKLGTGCQTIIIKLGTNDDDAGNMTTLQAACESGIATLKTNHPGASIYWLNVLPVWTNNTTGPEVAKNNIRAAIAAACTSQSITCWDSYTSPWLLQTDMNADGAHPSAGGQTKIGNQVKTLLGI